MLLRRTAFAALATCFALSLAACDFAGSDDGVSGRWAGVAVFETDSIIAEQNVRITANYETEFTFRLVDDEGLLTGQLVARTTGTRIVREAGQPADTLVYDSQAPIVHDIYGTFLDPVLEVDVPNGPYEANLWTFDVSGRNAELDATLIHTHTIPLVGEQTFQFTLNSTEVFEMRRVGDLENGEEEPPTEE